MIDVHNFPFNLIFSCKVKEFKIKMDVLLE